MRELVGLAEKARKDGLLALESELGDVDDAFMKTGLQLVVDGTEPELVREVLEGEIDGMEQRHKAGWDVFEKAGGFAPTIGIIGTVLSLIHVLGNLSDPGSLVPPSPARSSPRCWASAPPTSSTCRSATD